MNHHLITHLIIIDNEQYCSFLLHLLRYSSTVIIDFYLFFDSSCRPHTLTMHFISLVFDGLLNRGLSTSYIIPKFRHLMINFYFPLSSLSHSTHRSILYIVHLGCNSKRIFRKCSVIILFFGNIDDKSKKNLRGVEKECS